MHAMFNYELVFFSFLSNGCVPSLSTLGPGMSIVYTIFSCGRTNHLREVPPYGRLASLLPPRRLAL